jgi:hypothetical protein
MEHEHPTAARGLTWGEINVSLLRGRKGSKEA